MLEGAPIEIFVCGGGGGGVEEEGGGGGGGGEGGQEGQKYPAMAFWAKDTTT
jgi:hypothetical protein